eukprot:sb/3470498/
MDWIYSWITPPSPLNFEGDAVSLNSAGETMPSLDFETEAISLKSGSPKKVNDFHMGPGTLKVSMLLHSEARENLCKESYFHWLFGVREPGCSGAINCDTAEAILFIPRRDEESVVWKGPIRSQRWFIERYNVDECFYVDQISSVRITIHATLTEHWPDNFIPGKTGTWPGLAIFPNGGHETVIDMFNLIPFPTLRAGPLITRGR